jgi:hypothetical protein
LPSSVTTPSAGNNAGREGPQPVSKASMSMIMAAMRGEREFALKDSPTKPFDMDQ